MGTKRFFASFREAKSTMGPSAPPMVAMAAASLGLKPMPDCHGKRKKCSQFRGNCKHQTQFWISDKKVKLGNRPDAEKNHTGNKPVGEGERIYGLKKIHLHAR